MKAALISQRSKSSQWTFEAMTKYFSQVDDLDLTKIEITLGGESEVLYSGAPIREYDCIFAKGSFRYAQVLQAVTTLLSDRCYMPIRPDAFTFVHDKLLTHLVLQKSNIPMPRTYITTTVEAAKTLLREKIAYPVVMKFPRGTGGKGVMFADSYSSASSILDALVSINQPFVIQEYIETGGEDVRLLVTGDKVAASYKRIADVNERRANIHSGGRVVSYVPDSHTKNIAVRVAKVLGADMIGVDILESAKGPLVIEANLSPGLQGAVKATGVDVADRLAKYLHDMAADWSSKRSADAGKILEEVKNGAVKEIITTPNIRANRIILPEMVTEITKFSEHEDVVFEISKGSLVMKKF